jgi:hypothetical protein
MRSIALRPILAFAAALSCGPVADPPPSPAPVNVCQGQSDCDSYKLFPGVCPEGQVCVNCEDSICKLTVSFDFVMVIAMPDSAFAGAGATYAAPFSALRTHRCVDRSLPLCIRLPPIGQASGAYLANAAAAAPPFGRSLHADGVAAIPIHATLRPVWAFDTNPPMVDALAQNLPLLPLFAEVDPVESRRRAGGGVVVGPGNAATTVGYRAFVAPGNYERTMMPDPPFDDAFPPWITDITIGSYTAIGPSPPLADDLEPPLGEQPLDPLHKVHVTRSGGKVLDGFTAFLRDSTTLRRISTIKVLSGSATDATLWTLGQTKTDTLVGESIRDGVDLVIHPPDGLTVPEFALDTTSAGNIVPGNAEYPALPAPVTVSGVVEGGPDRKPTPANLFFQSTQIDAPTPDQTNPDLHFATRVSTDANGKYQVVLPPGKYDVVVVPPLAPDTPYAKTTASDYEVALSPASQQGRSIQLDALGVVNGACLVSDGRALAEAEVDATPSVSLRTSLDLKERDEARWPRRNHVLTNAIGAFSLPLDPGKYDITVRPADGTRLPWVIAREKTVVAAPPPLTPPPLTLDTVEVPPPIPVIYTLHDANEFPVVGALVHAYKLPPLDPKQQGFAALEIGRAVTDASGHFEMFLAGQPR